MSRSLCHPQAAARPSAAGEAGRRCALLAATLLLTTAILAGFEPLAAQQTAVEVHALKLVHQSANEALSLVEPLLSPSGTVELQTAHNTLVLRDRRETLDRIVALIQEFDHPPRRIRLELILLLASRDGPLTDTSTDKLPPWLVDGLGKLLRFNRYRPVAIAELEALEGQRVDYSLGRDYQVRFETGTVISNQRLRLRRFEVDSKDEGRLFFADLNLWLDKPLILGFARQESTGLNLVVALTCSQIVEPESRASGGGGT